MSEDPVSNQRRLWPRRLALASIALVALYALVGFVLLPAVALRMAGPQIEAALPCKASIDDIAFNPFLLTLEVRGLGIRSMDGEPIFDLDRLFVDVAFPTSLSDPIEISDLGIEGPRLDVIVSEAGDLNLMALVPRESEEPEEARKDDAPSAGPPPLLFRQIRIERGHVKLNDRSRRAAAGDLAIDMEPIELRLQDLEIGGSPIEPAAGPSEIGGSHVALSVDISGGGRLQIAGRLTPAPLQTDLAIELEGLTLDHFDALIEGMSNTRVPSGEIAVKGRLRYAGARGGGEASGDFAGELRLRDLSVRIADVEGDAGRVIGLGELAVEGIRADLIPARVVIERITLREPALWLTLEADGSSNLQRLARTSADEAGSDATSDAAPAEASGEGEREGEGAAPVVQIGEIRIEQGAATLSDRSTRRAVVLPLGAIQAVVKGISGDLSEEIVAELELRAAEQSTVALALRGVLEERARKVEARVDLRNLDMRLLSPYTEHYVGYPLEAGHLDLDLDYAVAGSQIDGKNGVVLDQLELGAAVPGEPVVKLPLKLGLGLLKDADGRIELDLGAKGDMQDPAFSIPGLLLDSLVNLLQKAATSPFQLLGGMLGGESLPSEIEFEPGSTTLAARQGAGLRRLAEAVRDRPALELGLRGAADAATDGPALTRRELEQALLVLHDEGRGSGGVDTLADARVLTTEERNAALRELHERWVSRSERRDYPPDTPEPTRLEGDLLAQAELAATPERLDALARQRVEVVSKLLIDAGKLAPERVRIDDAAAGGTQKPWSGVRIELRARN